MMADYISIHCDNRSVINLSLNLVDYNRTKHIKIRHDFVKVHVSKNFITLKFIDLINQLADIFTKCLSF